MSIKASEERQNVCSTSWRRVGIDVLIEGKSISDWWEDDSGEICGVGSEKSSVDSYDANESKKSCQWFETFGKRSVMLE